MSEQEREQQDRLDPDRHDQGERGEVHQDQGPLAQPDHRYTEDDQVQPEDATYEESDPDNPLSMQSTRDDETRSHPGGG